MPNVNLFPNWLKATSVLALWDKDGNISPFAIRYIVDERWAPGAQAVIVSEDGRQSEHCGHSTLFRLPTEQDYRNTLDAIKKAIKNFTGSIRLYWTSPNTKKAGVEAEMLKIHANDEQVIFIADNYETTHSAYQAPAALEEMEVIEEIIEAPAAPEVKPEVKAEEKEKPSKNPSQSRGGSSSTS